MQEVRQEAKKPPHDNNRASVKKVGGGGGGGHVAELANRLGKEGGIRIGPPVTGALKRGKVFKILCQNHSFIATCYNFPSYVMGRLIILGSLKRRNLILF